MKMLRNKKALQKMVIAVVLTISFNFIFPMYSNASGFFGGGNLFSPINDLFCGIGDGLMNLLQWHFLPNSPSAINYGRVIDVCIDNARKNHSDAEAYWREVLNRNSDDMTEEERTQWLAEIQRARTEADNAKNTLDTYTDLEHGGSYSWVHSAVYNSVASDYLKKQVVPCILYSPATIFSNSIPALDVNFINPKVYYSGGKVNFGVREQKVYVESYECYEGTVDNSNTANVLQNTIATWYKALRNISLVFLLSVLVYVAIRIILSTTAGETAKYKTMLKDWLVAMCILFFMHYAMAFLLKCTDMITGFLVDTPSSGVSEIGVDTFMGDIRDKTVDSEDEGMGFGYTVMYLTMVFYTLIFTYKYLKRLIYLAFLTMISPLVALTYPIDKIKDGSAQAFNKWFKEYLFNVLIQPIHLLLYSILITSAGNLASTNIIYSVIVLGFMLEAEKIIKDFFGIQTQRGEGSKAITGGAMFGAAASLVQKGLGALPKGSSRGDSSGSGKSNNGKLRFNDRDSDSDATKPLKAFMDNEDGDDKSSYGSKTRESMLSDSSSVGEGILGDSSESKNSSELPNDSPSYKTKFFQKAEQERAQKETAKKLAKAIEEEQKAKDKELKKNQIEAERARKAAAKEANKKRRIKNFANSSTGQRLKNFGHGASDLAKYIGTSKFGRGLGKGAKGLGIAGAAVGRTGWGALKAGGRTFRGVLNVGGRFVSRNGIKMAKFAGRTAIKGVGAATLGTIGLAAGLASGDDSDIIKYAGLGLAAGAATGGMIANSAGSIYGSLKNGGENLRDDFEQGYYGSDYEDKALNPRLDREWKRDKNVQAYYRRKYGSQYRQRMKESLEIRKAGITDQDDIDTALKLVKNGATTDQAANIMQFTKGVTRSDMFSSQKWENMQRLATQMVGENHPEKVDQIMQLVNQRFKLDKDWRPSSKENNTKNSNLGSSRKIKQVENPEEDI